jgi:hypothetical protein
MTVSAAPSTRADEAMAPIRATLAAMANRPGRPGLTGISADLTPTRPDQPAGSRLAIRSGWRPATGLVDGTALDLMLAAAREHWPAKPHVAAALAFKSYSYWLALPAVIGFATARRVPLLRPAGVLTSWSASAPFVRVGLATVDVAVLGSDPLAVGDRATLAANRIRVVPDEDALLTELRLSLVDGHLAPIVDQLRYRYHLGGHTLWGSLAAGIAEGLSRGSDVLAGPTLETAQRVLTALDLADLVELSATADGLSIQRRTCCLAFKLATPKVCAGCCIR